MNPELIRKLLESPYARELVAYLHSEAQKLNDLSTLEGIEPGFLAQRVLARLDAKKALDGMLAPFINSAVKPSGVDPKEFVV